LKQIPSSGSVLPFNGQGRIESSETGIERAMEEARADAGALVRSVVWDVSENLDNLLFPGHAASLVNSFKSRLWMSCWIDAASKQRDVSVKVLTGSLAGRIVIAMPLSIIHGPIFTKVSFAAQDVSDYTGIAFHNDLQPTVTPQLIDAIIDHIGVLFPKADCIDLRKYLFTHGAPVDGGSVHWRADREKSHLATLSGDWAKDVAGFVGKSSRNSLKRKRKKLDALGEVSFQEITSEVERKTGIETLCDWKAGQLEELGSANIFTHGHFRDFLQTTITRDDGKKDGTKTRLFGMFIDREPIALVHMLCSPDRWFLYQTAYTPDEAGKYSPGYMLILKVMEEASQAGVPVFDFGWGNESYKQRFASKSLVLYHGFVPLTLKGRLLMASNRTLELTKNFAKSNETMRSAAMLMLRVAGKLKSAFSK